MDRFYLKSKVMSRNRSYPQADAGPWHRGSLPGSANRFSMSGRSRSLAVIF